MNSGRRAAAVTASRADFRPEPDRTPMRSASSRPFRSDDPPTGTTKSRNGARPAETAEGAKQPRPNLRVVASPRKRRRRAGAVAICSIVVIFTFMISLAAFQAQLARNQLVLDTIESDLRTEQQAYDRSRAELARLESPQRIIDEATRLGMVPAGVPTYLAPSAGVVSEVLRAAGGGVEALEASGRNTRPDWSAYKRATNPGVLSTPTTAAAASDSENSDSETADGSESAATVEQAAP